MVSFPGPLSANASCACSALEDAGASAAAACLADQHLDTRAACHVGYERSATSLLLELSLPPTTIKP